MEVCMILVLLLPCGIQDQKHPVLCSHDVNWHALSLVVSHSFHAKRASCLALPLLLCPVARNDAF
jgi:hypothetical protein